MKIHYYVEGYEDYGVDRSSGTYLPLRDDWILFSRNLVGKTVHP